MKNAVYGLYLVGIIAASPAFGDYPDSGNIFSIDNAVPDRSKFLFYSNDYLEPARSALAVVSQFFLSNSKGQRVAVVALRNLTASTHNVSADEVVGVFADGEKRLPGRVELKLVGSEALSYAFDFGTSAFPLLYVYTRN